MYFHIVWQVSASSKLYLKSTFHRSDSCSRSTVLHHCGVIFDRADTETNMKEAVNVSLVKLSPISRKILDYERYEDE